MLPELKFWFIDFAWVSGLAFLFTTWLCGLDIKEMSSSDRPSALRAVLYIAILGTVGVTWFQAATDRERDALRVLSEGQRKTVVSMLKEYAPQKPKVKIFFVGDREAIQYAEQWKAVIREAGWRLIEPDNWEDHMLLYSSPGLFIEVKKETEHMVEGGKQIVAGAPWRLITAIREIGIDAGAIVSDEVEEGVINLNIGVKE